MTAARKVPKAPSVRFPVDPGDVPLEKVARRLHLTPDEFRQLEPKLRQRGFPSPDPDTQMYDLDRVDIWRASRHDPSPALTPSTGPIQHVADTMEERFIAAKRKTEGRGRHRGTS